MCIIYALTCCAGGELCTGDCVAGPSLEVERGLSMLATRTLVEKGSSVGEMDSATDVQSPDSALKMLEDLVALIRKEEEDEKKKFGEFIAFCDEKIPEKKEAIRTANETIERLEVEIKYSIADAAQLTKMIQDLNDDIELWTTTKEVQTKKREAERADYDKTHKDLSDAIPLLVKAMEALKAHYKKIPDSDKAAEMALKPIQKLLDDIKAQLSGVEKTETKAKADFKALIENLEGNIQKATKERDDHEAKKEQKLEEKIKHEAKLQETIAERADDTKYLMDVVAMCEEKKAVRAQRQEARKKELEALHSAIEILKKAMADMKKPTPTRL